MRLNSNLMKYIHVFDTNGSHSFSLNANAWEIGLIIGNINGGGNFLGYVFTQGTGTVYKTSIHQAGDERLTVSISNNVITFTAAGTTNFKYLVVIGLG